MDTLHISQFTQQNGAGDSYGRVFPVALDSAKTVAKLREIADEIEREGGTTLVQEIRILQRAQISDFAMTELTIVMHEALKK